MRHRSRRHGRVWKRPDLGTPRTRPEVLTTDATNEVFDKGWMMSFPDDHTSVVTPIVLPIRLAYTEKPGDFATEAKQPDQMTFAQLRRYIDAIRRSGYATEDLSVKLWQKTSWQR